MSGFPKLLIGYGYFPAFHYTAALALQMELHRRVLAGAYPVYLLFTTHDPAVITLGRHRDDGVQGDYLSLGGNQGLNVHKIGRGGGATLHNPGQLVCYPIAKIGALKKKLREFIADLEDAMIETCAHFGVSAGRRADLPIGIWAGNRKIASLGLQLLQGVTLHGLALNVCNDLSLFSHIHPCGMTSPDVMTSLSREGGREISVERVLPILAEAIACKWQGFAQPRKP